MNRTAFLIDGFNLYFSLKQASMDHKNAHTKWLDILSLCKSYRSTIGQTTGKRATVVQVHYFSAPVDHLITKNNPQILQRQKLYLRCLEDSGIIVEMGRFKRKYIKCPVCGASNLHHEEKETDVAIGARLLELFIRDKADTVVIVSGDTDIAAAVKIAQNIYPTKNIFFGLPYGRKNAELTKIAPTFTLTANEYIKYQFPDPVTLKNGKKITKPAKW